MTALRVIARICVAQAIAASLLSAQPLAKRTPDQLKASYEAHKSDFDYLLGDWEFTSESQEYGKFGGRWSAVRLDTGQILDEYRVLGENSQTLFATSTIRAFNAATDRWELIGMTSGGGLQDFGTARRVGSEIQIEQKFQVAEGKQIMLRIKYYNIEPSRFSWTADRSNDSGQNWIAGFQRIEARRIAPSRNLGPLTPARRP
ncbi:MAG: hypothetical protein H7Y20_08540 [Bryobacteraceae bacterium]|nr:hypothetical protein [Bryobacteraceae bacterium]